MFVKKKNLGANTYYYSRRRTTYAEATLWLRFATCETAHGLSSMCFVLSSAAYGVISLADIRCLTETMQTVVIKVGPNQASSYDRHKNKKHFGEREAVYQIALGSPAISEEEESI